MKRFFNERPAFYCHPDHGCRSDGCEGQSIDRPMRHGVGSNELVFAVACEHGQSVELIVFGTKFHRAAPRLAQEALRSMAPRAASLTFCTKVGDTDADPCPYTGGQCKSDVSGLQAEALWFWTGDNRAARRGGEQPALWGALELVVRDECDHCHVTDVESAAVSKIRTPPERSWYRCARGACKHPITARSAFRHRDLSGLYCVRCARRINDLNRPHELCRPFLELMPMKGGESGIDVQTKR